MSTGTHRLWHQEEQQLHHCNDRAIEAGHDASSHAEDGLGEDVGACEACPGQPACKVGKPCRTREHQSAGMHAWHMLPNYEL